MIAKDQMNGCDTEDSPGVGVTDETSSSMRPSGSSDAESQVQQIERLRVARILFQKGKVKEAWEMLDLGNETSNDKDQEFHSKTTKLGAQCARKLALEARRGKEFGKAVHWWRLAIELAPDTTEYRVLYAQSMILAGRLDEAWAMLLALQTHTACSSRPFSGGSCNQDHGAFRGIQISPKMDLSGQVAQLSAECATRLGVAANVKNAIEDATRWHRVAVGFAPDATRLRLRLAESLIRTDRLDEAEGILTELENGAANDPEMRSQMSVLRGKCARKRAYNAERPEGLYCVDGVDWSQVIGWRKEAARLLPNLRSNWVRLIYALIYARRFNESKIMMADAPSPLIRAHLGYYVGRAADILEKQARDGPNIYACYAPRYLDRGLPVVPTFGKCVIPRAWGQWSERPIRCDECKEWFGMSFANIGLVLGPQSGVSVIDIDTDDPVLIKTILATLPPSPWRRTGRRGMALAYRWTGINNLRCFDRNEDPIFEYLSTHTQIILPPSIHPQTGRPYRSNADLIDILDKLLALPNDVEQRLVGAIKAAGYTAQIDTF